MRLPCDLGQSRCQQSAIEEMKLRVSSDEDGSIHYVPAYLHRDCGDNQDAAGALEIRPVHTVILQSHPSHKNKDVARVGHPNKNGIYLPDQMEQMETIKWQRRIRVSERSRN